MACGKKSGSWGSQRKGKAKAGPSGQQRRPGKRASTRRR